MKNFILVLFLALFCTSTSFSQIGFSIGYKHLGATNWENLVASYNVSATDNISPLREGTDFALDYWFRLKKRRVEFHPELSYSRFIRNGDIKELKANFYNFSFHTNFYPFDFGEDCNCPTFSKDGSFIEKGFFFQVSPVASYLTNTYKDESNKEESNDFIFGIGIGAGIDFGISEFITLTPVVRYTYQFIAEWENLDQHLNLDAPNASDNNVSDITNVYIGFRLGFRFDELNKYGYR